jgi:hypothetical protein
VFAVITTVPVQEGSIRELAALFDKTNRARGYENLRASADFQQIMAQFSANIAGPLTVSINEILVEM